jgi:hypothetical protein
VESQPGSGTCFQIYFPVASSVVLVKPPVTRGLADARDVPSLRVLLADDEPPREAIAEYLRNAGHMVRESHSSQDALELARNHCETIDVLLTDVLMPGLRGTELAHKVGWPKRRCRPVRRFCRSLFVLRRWPNSLNS